MLLWRILGGISVALTACNAIADDQRWLFLDDVGRRTLSVEPGTGGNFIVRDAQGRRAGHAYRRSDGSIAVFDRNQKRVGTIHVPLEEREKPRR